MMYTATPSGTNDGGWDFFGIPVSVGGTIGFGNQTTGPFNLWLLVIGVLLLVYLIARR